MRRVGTLMKLPPVEHRNAVVLLTSSISPSRVFGVISTLMRLNSGSSSRPATLGVTVTPGATLLQRMPSAPYWQAMCEVSALRPPLAAVYAPPRQIGRASGRERVGRYV